MRRAKKVEQPKPTHCHWCFRRKGEPLAGLARCCVGEGSCLGLANGEEHAQPLPPRRRGVSWMHLPGRVNPVRHK